MKIYTKSGDRGATGLANGKRTSKSSTRIEAYGTVDETNVAIGAARDQLGLLGQPLQFELGELGGVQWVLFSIGSELALAVGKDGSLPAYFVADEDIVTLEQSIDRMDLALKPLTNFILPGGHPAVSACNVARVICRRAERAVVRLNEAEGDVRPEIGKYLNRLSDWCFVLGRHAASQLDIAETLWLAKRP